MLLPPAVSKHAEIQAAIADAQEALAPDVVRIRYSLAEDWNGDWALSFRVVLTDDAARHHLREVTWKVRQDLEQRLDYLALGVVPYHNFRSLSEQAAMQEPAWA